MKFKMKTLKVWQGILIVVSAILLVVAGVLIYVWQTSGFGAKTVYPQDVTFATDDNLNYNQATGQFEIDDKFQLQINSGTEELTEKELTLSFTVNFIEVADQDGFISDGVIKIPQKVNIGQPFWVETVKHNIQTGTDSEGNAVFEAWNNGGISNIYAKTTNNQILPTHSRVAVDVPVEHIDLQFIDSATGEPAQLTEGVYPVTQGADITLLANFYPQESAYLYSGNTQRKVYVDILNPSQNANITLLTNEDGQRYFTANGALLSSATFKAYAFKNAADQIKNMNVDDSSVINFLSNEGQSSAVSSQKRITISEAQVSSFNSALSSTNFTINKQFEILATNVGGDANLGIEIFNNQHGQNRPVLVMIRNVAMRALKEEDGQYVETDEVKISGSKTTKIGDSTYTLINPGSPANYSNFFISSDTAGSYRLEVVLLQRDVAVEAEAYTIFDDKTITFDVTFNKPNLNEESELSWTDSSSINMMVNKASSEPTEWGDLSTIINHPNSNYYQTVKFLVQTTENASDRFVLEDANSHTILGQSNLYILDGSFLRVKEGGNYKLYFATIKTRADGSAIKTPDGEYQYVKLSSPIDLIAVDTVSTEFSVSISGGRPSQTEEEKNVVRVGEDITMTIQAGSTIEAELIESQIGNFSVEAFDESNRYSLTISSHSRTSDKVELKFSVLESIVNQSQTKALDLRFRLIYTPAVNIAPVVKESAEVLEAYIPVATTIDVDINPEKNIVNVQKSFDKTGNVDIKLLYNGLNAPNTLKTVEEFNNDVLSKIKVMDQHGIETSTSFTLSCAPNNVLTTSGQTINVNNDASGQAILQISAGSALRSITFSATAAYVEKATYLADGDGDLFTNQTKDNDVNTVDMNYKSEAKDRPTSVEVKKLGFIDNEVTLSNLLKLTIKADNDGVDIDKTSMKFVLTAVDGQSYDEIKNILFGTDGMIQLNKDAAFDVNNLTSSTQISSFKINKDFGRDVTLTFEVIGLPVVFTLNVKILSNISSSSISFNETTYKLTGDVNSEISAPANSVYAMYGININDVITLVKVYDGDGENSNTTVNLSGITKQNFNFDGIDANNEIIYFTDVTKVTTYNSCTFYQYGSNNSYGFVGSFSITVYPNYKAALANEKNELAYLDLTAETAGKKFDNLITISRYVGDVGEATESISQVGDTQAPTGLNYDLDIDNAYNYLLRSGENIIRNEGKQFELKQNETFKPFKIGIKQEDGSWAKNYNDEELLLDYKLVLGWSTEEIAAENGWKVYNYNGVQRIFINATANSDINFSKGKDEKAVDLTTDSNSKYSLTNGGLRFNTSNAAIIDNSYLLLTRAVDGKNVFFVEVPIIVSFIGEPFAHYAKYMESNPNFDLYKILQAGSDVLKAEGIYTSVMAGQEINLLLGTVTISAGDTLKIVDIVGNTLYVQKIIDNHVYTGKVTLESVEGFKIGDEYTVKETDSIILYDQGIKASEGDKLKIVDIVENTMYVQKIDGGHVYTGTVTLESVEGCKIGDEYTVKGTDSITLIPEGISPYNETSKMEFSLTEGDGLASITSAGMLTIKSLAGNEPQFIKVNVSIKYGSPYYSYEYLIRVLPNTKLDKEYPYAGAVDYQNVNAGQECEFTPKFTKDGQETSNDYSLSILSVRIGDGDYIELQNGSSFNQGGISLTIQKNKLKVKTNNVNLKFEVRLIATFENIVNGTVVYTYMFNMTDFKYFTRYNNGEVGQLSSSEGNATWTIDPNTNDDGQSIKVTTMQTSKTGDNSSAGGVNPNVVETRVTYSVDGDKYKVESTTPGEATVSTNDNNKTKVATLEYDYKDSNLTVTIYSNITDELNIRLSFTAVVGTIYSEVDGTLLVKVRKTVIIEESNTALTGGQKYQISNLVNAVQHYDKGYKPTDDDSYTATISGVTYADESKQGFISISENKTSFTTAMLYEDLTATFEISVVKNGETYTFYITRTISKNLRYKNNNTLTNVEDDSYIYNYTAEYFAGSQGTIAYDRYLNNAGRTPETSDVFSILNGENTTTVDSFTNVIEVNNTKVYLKIDNTNGITFNGITFKTEFISADRQLTIPVHIQYTFNGFSFDFYVRISLTAKKSVQQSANYPNPSGDVLDFESHETKTANITTGDNLIIVEKYDDDNNTYLVEYTAESAKIRFKVSGSEVTGSSLDIGIGDNVKLNAPKTLYYFYTSDILGFFVNESAPLASGNRVAFKNSNGNVLFTDTKYTDLSVKLADQQDSTTAYIPTSWGEITAETKAFTITLQNTTADVHFEVTYQSVPLVYTLSLSNRTSVFSTKLNQTIETSNGVDRIYPDVIENAKLFENDRLVKIDEIPTTFNEYVGQIIRITFEGDLEKYVEFRLDSTLIGKKDLYIDAGCSLNGYKFVKAERFRVNRTSGEENLGQISLGISIAKRVELYYFTSSRGEIEVSNYSGEVTSYKAGSNSNNVEEGNKSFDAFDANEAISSATTDTLYTLSFELKLNKEDKDAAATGEYNFMFLLDIDAVNTVESNSYVTISANDPANANNTIVNLAQIYHPSTDRLITAEEFKNETDLSANISVFKGATLGDNGWTKNNDEAVVAFNNFYQNAEENTQKSMRNTMNKMSSSVDFLLFFSIQANGEVADSDVASQAEGTNDRRVWDYQLYGLGAENIGSFVMVTYEYKITRQEDTLTKKIHVMVKIEPNYKVTVNNGTTTSEMGDTQVGEQTVKANTTPVEIRAKEVKLSDDNKPLNPAYSVNVAGDTKSMLSIKNTDRDGKEYESSITEDWTFKLIPNAQEGSKTFNTDLDKLKYGGSLNGDDNVIDGKLPSEFEENKSEHWTKEQNNDKVVSYTWDNGQENSGQVLLSKAQENIFGRKSYKIEITNRYGFTIFLYFDLIPKNDQNPSVASGSMTAIPEGESFDIGAVYEKLTLSALKTNKVEDKTYTLYQIESITETPTSEGLKLINISGINAWGFDCQDPTQLKIETDNTKNPTEDSIYLLDSSPYSNFANMTLQNVSVSEITFFYEYLDPGSNVTYQIQVGKLSGNNNKLATTSGLKKGNDDNGTYKIEADNTIYRNPDNNAFTMPKLSEWIYSQAATLSNGATNSTDTVEVIMNIKLSYSATDADQEDYTVTTKINVSRALSLDRVTNQNEATVADGEEFNIVDDKYIINFKDGNSSLEKGNSPTIYDDTLVVTLPARSGSAYSELTVKVDVNTNEESETIKNGETISFTKELTNSSDYDQTNYIFLSKELKRQTADGKVEGYVLRANDTFNVEFSGFEDNPTSTTRLKKDSQPLKFYATYNGICGENNPCEWSSSSSSNGERVIGEGIKLKPITTDKINIEDARLFSNVANPPAIREVTKSYIVGYTATNKPYDASEGTGNNTFYRVEKKYLVTPALYEEGNSTKSLVTVGYDDMLSGSGSIGQFAVNFENWAYGLGYYKGTGISSPPSQEQSESPLVDGDLLNKLRFEIKLDSSSVGNATIDDNGRLITDENYNLDGDFFFHVSIYVKASGACETWEESDGDYLLCTVSVRVMDQSYSGKRTINFPQNTKITADLDEIVSISDSKIQLKKYLETYEAELNTNKDKIDYLTATYSGVENLKLSDGSEEYTVTENDVLDCELVSSDGQEGDKYNVSFTNDDKTYKSQSSISKNSLKPTKAKVKDSFELKVIGEVKTISEVISYFEVVSICWNNPDKKEPNNYSGSVVLRYKDEATSYYYYATIPLNKINYYTDNEKGPADPTKITKDNLSVTLNNINFIYSPSAS